MQLLTNNINFSTTKIQYLKFFGVFVRQIRFSKISINVEPLMLKKENKTLNKNKREHKIYLTQNKKEK